MCVWWFRATSTCYLTMFSKVRLYLRWFVGLMTYLRYLCYLRIVVFNIYCVVFLCCLSSSSVLCTLFASFSGLSMFDCPLGIIWRFFIMVFSYYDSNFIIVLKEALSMLHRCVILTTSMCKITWSHIIEISTFAKNTNSTGTLHRHQR